MVIAYQRYKLPIYITENGYGAHETLDAAGGVNDPGRIAYLADYTKAIEQAVASGVDVRGYFLWSMLDNLEWGAGFASRFGVVFVDYATAKACPQGVVRLVCRVDPGAAEMIEGWVTRNATSLLQPMQPAAFSKLLPQDALPTIDVDDSQDLSADRRLRLCADRRQCVSAGGAFERQSARTCCRSCLA